MVIHAAAVFCALAFDAVLIFAAVTAAARARVPFHPRALETGIWIAATAAVQAAIVARYGDGMPAMTLACAAGCATVCAFTDVRCGYIFDAVTVPTLAIIVALAFVDGSVAFAAAGAAISGGTLFALHVLTGGRGLGLGDVKLACCTGAALGARNGIVSLGAAFVAGGMYATFLLVTRRARRGQEIAFAPYIAAGMAAALMAGNVW